jgi:hypothetical protein
MIGSAVDSVTASQSGTAREIRNNNPGNIVRNNFDADKSPADANQARVLCHIVTLQGAHISCPHGLRTFAARTYGYARECGLS